MATLSVYVCPGANQSVDASGAPVCTGGAGSWQSVQIAEPFSITELDFSVTAGAFGAGFVNVGGLMLVAAVVRKVRSAANF